MKGYKLIPISLAVLALFVSKSVVAESFTLQHPPAPAAQKNDPRLKGKRGKRYIINEPTKNVEKDVRVKAADKMIASAWDEYRRIENWKKRGDRSPASESTKNCLSPWLASAEKTRGEMQYLTNKLRYHLGIRDFDGAEGAMEMLKQKEKDLKEAENDAVACMGDDPDVPDSL